MSISHKLNPIRHPYHIDSVLLKKISSIKDLGTTFEEKFGKVFFTRSAWIFVTLIDVLHFSVRSQLEYAVIVWHWHL